MNGINLKNIDFKTFFTEATLVVIVKVGLLIIIGVPLIYLLRKWIRTAVTRQYNAHYGMLAGKVVFNTLAGLIIITVMHQLGLGLEPILGAAGIVGIALGVASQTSVSNIISGFFMLAEQSFMVGDVISVGDKTGIVLTVDTLSVKLRTFDNKFVRIPNETMIKSEVTNITRFPIRRIDIVVSVAYKEDITEVKEILLDIATQNPMALQEPEPIIFFKEFNSSSIDFQFSVWATKEDWLNLKNELYETIKRRFDEANIEIPFPHISLYKGEVTDAFPIKIVNDEKNSFEPKSNS
ncbi:MAG TPA: mechanosensitive ion channel family protein [Balneolales bacterium]|nr:mechanosensitive ion channel family protein [Balneolales bacterium]